MTPRYLRPRTPDDPGGVTPMSHDPAYDWCRICRRPLTVGLACPHLSLDGGLEASQ